MQVIKYVHIYGRAAGRTITAGLLVQGNQGILPYRPQLGRPYDAMLENYFHRSRVIVTLFINLKSTYRLTWQITYFTLLGTCLTTCRQTGSKIVLMGSETFTKC